MADVVQFRLERMIDELEDLSTRGLFNQQELAEIVKRRRDFEYRLKRPRPLKQDFLDYVSYETNIDALRLIRKKKIVQELKRKEEGGEKKSGKLWKRSISDIACVNRILEIYRVAVVKNKGDLDLWFRYLEFCRERKHGRMKQVLAQAIRFHPNVPGLWIYASSWEFDHNLNVTAARALMQSGLRECPTSEDLWIEYLRMELTYLNKLKIRKIALGEEEETPVRAVESDESRKWKEENADLFLSFNEERASKESDADSERGSLEPSESFFWKHGSSILRTIYEGAVAAMPESMNLRMRFLEILDNVDIIHSKQLKEEVMEDIKSKFSSEECYWDWIARLEIDDAKKASTLSKNEVLCALNSAIQVYEDALNLLPSPKMFSLYAKFYSGLSSQDTDGMNDLLCYHSISIVEFDSKIVKMFEKIKSCGYMNDDLAHQCISYYLQIGRSNEAKKIAEDLCSGALSNGPKLWSLRISMEIKCLVKDSSTFSTPGLNHVFDLFKIAISKVSVAESVTLLQEAISFFSSRKHYFEKIMEIIMIQLAKSSCDECLFPVCRSIISWNFQRGGIQSARTLYQRILSLPRPSLSCFRYCIDLESNIALSGDSNAIPIARKIFESAISIYGKTADLWREYYSFETKVGTSENATAVYWRSQKVLKGASILVDEL